MLGRLLGTWELISWHNDAADGTRHHPLGEDATGQIIYAADGHVSVALSAADRTPFAVNDPFGGTDAENAAAMRSHITYVGHFTLDGKAVIHHVHHASCPNWVGTRQRREVTFWPNGTLQLSASDVLFDGQNVPATVLWKRP